MELLERPDARNLQQGRVMMYQKIRAPEVTAENMVQVNRGLATRSRLIRNTGIIVTRGDCIRSRNRLLPKQIAPQICALTYRD
jgi:hypothetical protein